MIRLFLLCLAISIFGLWLTLFLGFPGDAGYLLIAFGNYTFETSLFALLILSGVIYLLFRILKLIVSWVDLPRLLRIKELYDRKQKEKAHNATTEGYIQLFLGNWATCYKSLVKGLEAKDVNIVNYLAASYAAFKGAESGKWVRHLADAEEKFPFHKPTIELMRAQFLFETDQLDEAKVIIENLKKNTSYDSRLMLLLKDYYLKIEEWPALKVLLPKLERNRLIKPGELEDLKIQSVKSEITAISGKIGIREDKESIKTLMSLWKKTPNKVCEDEELILFYANTLLTLGGSREALNTVEKVMTKKWSDRLVLFYGENDFGRNSHQLVTAEKWLKIESDSSVLFLTLARISLRNELKEKAMKYYESSIASSPSAEAYLELSMLLGRVGDEDASLVNLKHYYKFIAADTMNLPLVS